MKAYTAISAQSRALRSPARPLSCDTCPAPIIHPHPHPHFFPSLFVPNPKWSRKHSPPNRAGPSLPHPRCIPAWPSGWGRAAASLRPVCKLSVVCGVWCVVLFVGKRPVHIIRQVRQPTTPHGGTRLMWQRAAVRMCECGAVVRAYRCQQCRLFVVVPVIRLASGAS